MCANNTKMQRPVSGMHIAHGLMHRRSLDFELGGGLNRKSCNDVIKSPRKEGLFMGLRIKIKSWVSDLVRNLDLLQRKD